MKPTKTTITLLLILALAAFLRGGKPRPFTLKLLRVREEPILLASVPAST